MQKLICKINNAKRGSSKARKYGPMKSVNKKENHYRERWFVEANYKTEKAFRVKWFLEKMVPAHPFVPIGIIFSLDFPESCSLHLTSEKPIVNEAKTIFCRTKNIKTAIIAVVILTSTWLNIFFKHLLRSQPLAIFIIAPTCAKVLRRIRIFSAVKWHKSAPTFAR